jgi:hypothetical protein
MCAEVAAQALKAALREQLAQLFRAEIEILCELDLADADGGNPFERAAQILAQLGRQCVELQSELEVALAPGRAAGAERRKRQTGAAGQKVASRQRHGRAPDLSS